MRNLGVLVQKLGMDFRIIALVIMASLLFLVQSDVKIDKEDKEQCGKLHFETPKPEVQCSNFFFGTVFPRMKGNQSGLIKLCQAQQHEGYIGPVGYASFFNIYERIPVYSASVLQMYPNCSGYSRPDEKYWKRVSLELCDLNTSNLPEYPIISRLGSAGQGSIACGKFQALDRDYKGNRELLDVDRGHLNPNAINCQNQENQIATFTLTNAAPQFSSFNEIAWKHYECMTELVLLKHIPSERAYIITGTWDVAKDKDGNPLWMNAHDESKNSVKVPGYYWKAVCYPGNPWKGTSPWGFAIVHANSDPTAVSTPDSYMKLQEFSTNYFQDDLFDNVCLTAGLGPIQSYFQDWKETIDTKCNNLGLACSR